MRRRWLVILGLALIPVLGAVLWFVWPEPEPPPSTADEVIETVLGEDPTELSGEELDRWMARVVATVDRLPPHEFQPLVQKAMANAELRARFESLEPEQRRRLRNLVSEEQRAQMGAGMAKGMVAVLKAMPKALRDTTIREFHERAKARRGEHGRREMTPKRFAEWHAATTPKQRAEFVRAMRDMRQMMEDAGVAD